MAKNESKTLNESFEISIDPEINSNLENLRGWIYPELFAQFEDKVKKIIGENPGSEDVVIAELGKTQLSAENLFENYNRVRLPGVIHAAANDDDFSLAA